MANVLAPFGFSQVGVVEGLPPNFATTRKEILYSNSTPIYRNDPVTISSGYVVQSTAGTTQIDGIFQGCEYLSVSQGRWVWSAYWPGSDASSAAPVYASIIDTPVARFLVQANGQLAKANVNKNVNFALGTGNTATGQSGATIDTTTIATTNTLPFRILQLVTDPAGQNGSDLTTPYSYALVTFNNQDLKSLTGL